MVFKIMFILTFLVYAKRNKPILDSENLRTYHPKIHSLLHDDEISILIISPWNKPEKTFTCNYDFDITALFVFRDNYQEYREMLLKTVVSAEYKKVTFDQFLRLERRVWLNESCEKLKIGKIETYANKYNDIYVLIPKLWAYDANSIFYMEKRKEKYLKISDLGRNEL